MTRPRLEVADVFRDHGDAFLDRYGDTLSPEQRRALRDIAACRTAALGGHVEECDRCGHQRIAYNSCRNRHCPKCQATAAAQWMEAREAELLPVEYLSRGLYAPGGARSDRLAEPAGGLRPPVPRRRRDLAADRRRSRSTSGPRSGSWPSCTPGARTSNTTPMCTAWCREVGSRPTARAGSPVGRDSSSRCACSAASSGASSSRCCATPSIRESSPSTGSSARWRTPGEFRRRLTASAQTEWVVYAKPPFGGPEQVLKYLARYTHRVAISNRRLVALEDGEVKFHWKDYAHGGGQKTMTLKATEFIRRFLLHVLPSGFVRIRHYGFLANRVCREKLALCRALLGVEATPEPVASEPSAEPKETVEGEPAAKRLSLLRRGPDGDRRVLRSDPGRIGGSGGRSLSRSALIRPEPSALGESDLPISVVETALGGDRGFPVCRAGSRVPNAVEEALVGSEDGQSTSLVGGSHRPGAVASRLKHPCRRPRPRLNPHSRGDPRGSVQSIVSEVPTRPFVRASCCRRHFGYNPLHF